MKKARILFFVLGLIGILLITGTAFAADSPTFAVYALNSEPLTNWDPAIEFSNGIHVHNNMYEQLLRYDSIEEKIIPCWLNLIQFQKMD